MTRPVPPIAPAKLGQKVSLPPIGRRIRALRKLQRLRLLDLAGLAGCSESLLSRIETGRVMPSLSTLHRLSQGLRVNVAVLMEDKQDRTCTVYSPETRPRTAHSTTAEGDGSTAESLVPYSADGRLEALIVRLPGDGPLCGPFSHNGEEVGMVLDGILELIVDGELYLVPAGSSFYFGSDHTHSYRAASAAPCRVVWINTPPTF